VPRAPDGHTQPDLIHLLTYPVGHQPADADCGQNDRRALKNSGDPSSLD
jgi:hypothetical protein